MKVLSVDTSARTCSVALYNNGIVDEIFIDENLTHSETLAPLTEELINKNKVSLSEIDYLAVNAGPGSFTGVRIGISFIKGIADVYDIPCVSVSTLESMAYNLLGEDKYVCSLMDARNNRYYYAVFEIKDGKVLRLTDDDVKTDEEITDELLKYDCVTLVGDGAEKFYENSDKESYVLAENDHLYQCAASVNRLALLKIRNNEVVSSAELMPVYLRPSQAERERMEREEENKK